MLLTHIDASHSDIVSSCDSAASMWKKLCALYEKSSDQRLDRLLENFFNFRAEGDIARIVSSLQKLFSEINIDLEKVCKITLPD